MQVLICSNDKRSGERFWRIAREFGYKTTLFLGSKDERLLTFIRRNRPEILLCFLPFSDVKTLVDCIVTTMDYMPAVILVGRAQDCGADVFAVNAVDYLIPPVAKDALRQALQKTTQLNAAQSQLIAHYNEQASTFAKATNVITARTHKGFFMIPLSDVYYLSSDQKYVKVRHKNGTVLLDDSLKTLEQRFGDIFVRIHRNALINLKFLHALTKDNDQYRVYFQGLEDSLVVARRHLSSLRTKIKTI